MNYDHILLLPTITCLFNKEKEHSGKRERKDEKRYECHSMLRWEVDNTGAVLLISVTIRNTFKTQLTQIVE